MIIMYRCLLPSSVTVKMDNEENMENGRYATNDDTPLWTKDWIILCCCMCNCIMIMSLNTYNKNVDIIWHYCIISQITLHGFWKRSALTNMMKDALKYMINRLWYGIVYITCYINPQPILVLRPSALRLIWASRV